MEICLVDNSNIINICYAVFVKTMKDKNGQDYLIKKDDLGMFYHLYMRKIKDYLSTYEEIVFCGEGHNSTKWRKEQYPLYKENRKDRADNPDYAFIIDCYKGVDELLKLFHCKVMRVEDCEADDVIYKLSEYYSKKNYQITIMSSDKDLTQIMGFFDGVDVINPINKEHREQNENIILEKALVGDPSDNIKGVPKVGAKTFEKMLTDKELWNKKMTPENTKLYESILSIVDLRKYPKEFQDKIIDIFEKTKYNDFDINGVEKFFLDNGLNQCLKNWSEWAGEISMCLNGNKQETAEDDLEDLLNNGI